MGGVDEFGDGDAGLFVGVGGEFGELVDAAVDIGVLFGVIINDRVDDDLRFLGGGGVV